MDKRQIKKLIEAYVNDVFNNTSHVLLGEQEDELDLGGGGGEADDLGDLDIGGDEGGDLGGDDLGGGDEGGDLDLGGDEGGLEGEEGEEDLGDDMGGDFGGGGGGGFGGGGGMGDDGGDFGDEGEEGEGEDDGEEEPAEVELPDDPVQAAVNIAINMVKETGDDNRILAAVKGSVQQNFGNFNDALPIIKSLWDTEHPILKVVARKLLLFIQGT